MGKLCPIETSAGPSRRRRTKLRGFRCVRVERKGANLFFQLISRRYERGPMILTSNQSFGTWAEVFGDRVIATAMLDRVLHHAITLNIRGRSYRLKDKLKSGVVPAAETESVD